jgi:hypothetical protein
MGEREKKGTLTLSITALYHYAESHVIYCYAECSYARCRGTKVLSTLEHFFTFAPYLKVSKVFWTVNYILWHLIFLAAVSATFSKSWANLLVTLFVM